MCLSDCLKLASGLNVLHPISCKSFYSCCRAESAIIAALLHDVLDDTSVKVQQIEDQFGTEVASMVSKVSQLSSMNQLLRRRRRQLVSPIVLNRSFLHGS